MSCSTACGYCGGCTDPWDERPHDEDPEMYLLTAHIPLLYKLRDHPALGDGYPIAKRRAIRLTKEAVALIHLCDAHTGLPVKRGPKTFSLSAV